MNHAIEKPAKPKLSVYTEPEMIRRLRIEKAETSRTIEDLVNERLRLSYQHHPEPLAVPVSAATA